MVDGDKALVVTDKTLISVAERNIKKFDIVPLYYNMKKASSVQLTNESIYNGLNAAFTGSNIGQYSNDISKIWNNEIFVSGSYEEKMEAINVIKLLCCENNFSIDYAKTLYKPERPEFVKDLISRFTKEKVPYFFRCAKDKEDNQVADSVDTFVNKLDKIIPNPRINCRSLGLDKPDYRLLMTNPDIECRVEFTSKGKLVKENTDPLIIKYCELSQQYGMLLNNATQAERDFSTNVLMQTQHKQYLIYQNTINQIKNDLSVFGYEDSEIADILVKFLYGIRDSKHKMILWVCYGEYLLNNLEKRLKYPTKDVQCVDCGKWFEVNTKDNRTCRCEECMIEHKRNLTRLRVERFRNKNVTQTS